MNNKLSRNDACHCGSGKKFKACHGRSSKKPYQLWALVGVLVLAALWFFFYESESAVTPNRLSSPLEPSPPGKVWSVEHNHWHDAPSSPTSTTSSPVLNELQPQPQGAAPPGKVWSVEHNHWHDAPSSPAPTTSSTVLNELQPQPQGAAPPGKVWSPEHGHWHDKQ